jgi:glycosyltransferase involved in cell wall biosynthesis
LENLKRLFKSFETEKIQNKIEVIVVDSISNDGTKEFVESKSYAKITEKESTPGEARNIGIKNASHDIVAMLDADTEVTKDWYYFLERSMSFFDIVAGYSPGKDVRQLPRVPIVINGQDITYPQCNIAYKKDVFERNGYLREDMSVGEDCEFHFRCVENGEIIFYQPLMVAYHYERPTKMQWIKKQIKNGFGRYELEKIHPELKHKSLHGMRLKGFVRLGFGALGYLKGKIFGGKIET